MVAIAGKFAFERGEFAAQNVCAEPRLKWWQCLLNCLSK